MVRSSMVVTKAGVVKTTAAGTAVPMHSIAGDRSKTAAAYSLDGAPLIDGACGGTGVRMMLAPAAWRRFLQ